MRFCEALGHYNAIVALPESETKAVVAKWDELAKRRESAKKPVAPAASEPSWWALPYEATDIGALACCEGGV